MLKLKLKIIFFCLLSILITHNLNAKIKIKYKIDDIIITNIDIINEKNYLIFLRPDLKNINENEILEISKNSLIREIIKKKELDKIFKNPNNSEFLDELKKNLFNFKRVKSEKEFIELTKKNNIEYEKIIEKMKYEGLWNELIFQKYNNLVKIDEKKLRSELLLKISSDIKYEYNLSEILFEIENNENIEDKYNIIVNFINKNDFKSAASKYSISDSANRGGEIGWIKETLLSDNLSSVLKKINDKGLTKPLKYPNGYLILKINDKKKMQQVISIDKELKDLIRFEKNRQLNQFSLLYFKKLKQNTIIDEY